MYALIYYNSQLFMLYFGYDNIIFSQKCVRMFPLLLCHDGVELETRILLIYVCVLPHYLQVSLKMFKKIFMIY